MLREKHTIIIRCIPIALVILGVLMVSSAGCIKIAQNALGGEKTGSTNSSATSPDSPSVSMAVIPPNASTSLPDNVPTPQITDSVTEFSPPATPDPYPIIHGVRINATPQYSFLTRTPEFTRTYALAGNAVGLLVNVVQGPLYIEYTITPKYDCLNDPESCRGTVLVPVNRPYMTITVRDNQTQQIVAEGGYAREYSSDTGNYQYTNTVASADSTENGTYTSEPEPRYLSIYREGQFQIIMDGDYLDVTISIITGEPPDMLTAQETSASSTPVTISDHEEG